jgi:hypothetical protein
MITISLKSSDIALLIWGIILFATIVVLIVEAERK